MQENAKKSTLALIRTTYKLFSESQKQVADFVLANPAQVILLPIAELAAACKVSEPTVMRFLHKMNYRSYQMFRVHIAQDNAPDTSQALYSDVDQNDSSSEIIRKVLTSTQCALNDLQGVLKPESLEKICAAIHEAKKVLIIGVGSTYAVAFDFYHKLLKLGINALCSNDPHIINITCNSGLKEKGSVLIAISHSGESREILDGVALAKQSGCPVYGITSFKNSTLARQSDEVLLSTSLETAYRSDALTSRIMQLCIVDMLYINLALLSGSKAIENIQNSRMAVARNKT
jgi:DNA-binding MurR/RpiR family transcriptional regulator